MLPVNLGESKFVQCQIEGNAIWNLGDLNIKKSSKPIFQTSNNNDGGDLLCDTFKLHFTSRNYLGSNSYDGFIITVHIYDKLKNKIGLLSQYIKKTDTIDINENPVILNQKLYTAHLDFTIPNVHAILNCDLDWIKRALNDSEKTLKKALFPKYDTVPNYDIMDNTPVVMSIYGVKSTTVKNNYEYYTVEKLNSIYIPIIDKSNGLSINIQEAKDGDYFIISPELYKKQISFPDFIYNLSIDENGVARPELYIVFHALNLIEHYVDNTNVLHNDITHKEQFVINAAREITDDGKVETIINEEDLGRQIYYRPVLRKTGKVMWFTIEVKTYIINTLDNTTTVIKGSLDYGNPNDENAKDQDPKKYGKKMNKIFLGEVPAKVNVYNRKPDIDIDGVKITNASSNVKIENHQHSVIGFIECANVGVAIEQVPKESLE